MAISVNFNGTFLKNWQTRTINHMLRKCFILGGLQGTPNRSVPKNPVLKPPAQWLAVDTEIPKIFQSFHSQKVPPFTSEWRRVADLHIQWSGRGSVWMGMGSQCRKSTSEVNRAYFKLQRAKCEPSRSAIHIFSFKGLNGMLITTQALFPSPEIGLIMQELCLQGNGFHLICFKRTIKAKRITQHF